MLIVTVYLGLFLHLFFVYPPLYYLTTRKNPWTLLKQGWPAVVTAFGTSSSAASFPVVLKCAQDAGLPDAISKFVLSLGMTMSMDGTAIGYPLQVIWLAAAQGNEISVVCSCL